MPRPGALSRAGAAATPPPDASAAASVGWGRPLPPPPKTFREALVRTVAPVSVTSVAGASLYFTARELCRPDALARNASAARRKSSAAEARVDAEGVAAVLSEVGTSPGFGKALCADAGASIGAGLRDGGASLGASLGAGLRDGGAAFGDGLGRGLAFGLGALGVSLGVAVYFSNRRGAQ